MTPDARWFPFAARRAGATERRHRSRDSMESTVRIRWVLVCLAAVLSVVLIASGELLIGALIGAIAVIWIVVFVKRQQWRDEMRRRYPRRFDASPRD